jgi:hypothetical protein
VATVLLKWFRKEAYSINLQLVSLNGFCHQFLGQEKRHLSA